MSSSRRWPCAALRDASLSSRTTLGVGGAAEVLLEPATPDELVAAWSEARERGIRPRVLGGGANLVVDDGPLPGVVLSTERLRRTFRALPPDADPEGALAGERDGAGPFEELLPRVAHLERTDAPRLVAWAGASMPGLCRAAQALGWSGLEGLVGVPGSLGGGVAMNAGGRWGEMWDAVELVRVLGADGELRDLPREECAPRYRDGNLGEGVVVAAVLRLSLDDPAAVRERMREYLVAKKAAQPVTEPSAGCIFRNPDPERSEGRSAGRLVDDCGGRGLARGGAVVSPKHGNFVVNAGGATAADVLALVEDVRALVRERTGIELEREVRVWSADPAVEGGGAAGSAPRPR